MRVYEELNSEEDAIAHLHDLAMSDNPQIAAYGRLMKRLVPVVMAWANDETGRIKTAHDAAYISQAVPLAAASFIASCLGTIGPSGKAPPPHLLKLCGRITNGALNAMADGEDVMEALIRQQKL